MRDLTNDELRRLLDETQAAQDPRLVAEANRRLSPTRNAGFVQDLEIQIITEARRRGFKVVTNKQKGLIVTFETRFEAPPAPTIRGAAEAAPFAA